MVLSGRICEKCIPLQTDAPVKDTAAIQFFRPPPIVPIDGGQMHDADSTRTTADE
jgi:hypothetical protein